jgi:heme exporter protein B
MITRAKALLLRELRLSWKRRAESAGTFLFILLMVTLFPFALSPLPERLHDMAAGLLILAILLGQMLQAPQLFHSDWQNGTLDFLSLEKIPLSLYALIACISQWLCLMLPILILSPLLMLLLNVPPFEMPGLFLALLPATFVFALLNMLGAALVVGAGRAGLLLPLLLVPFYIPVLIFAVRAAEQNAAITCQAFLFLSALLLLAISTLPFAAGSALRSSVEAG